MASITKEQTAEIVAKFGETPNDTGSPAVQIALLTARIQHLAGHIREHRQDMHNRRGLVMMVGKRNRLLRYLQRTDRERYVSTIQALGLRK